MLPQVHGHVQADGAVALAPGHLGADGAHDGRDDERRQAHAVPARKVEHRADG